MSQKKTIVFIVLAVALGGYMSKPRGIRNKNPFNIREGENGGDLWVGEHALDLDTSFEEFVDFKHGIRAGVKVIRNYSALYGRNTIQQIIERFAPPRENNTAAYIESVASYMQTSPAEQLNLNDVDVLFKLSRAIIRHEQGSVWAATINDKVVNDGIRLALA